jgi:NAD-dependent deacetylase
MAEAMALTRAADLFIVVGSSLVVQPAATLPLVAKEAGAALAIVNRDSTPLDPAADILVRASIGRVFSTLYPQAIK